MRAYGLTLQAFEEMLIAQDGRCSICRKKVTGKGCHVDHDAKTGKVRGLLCFSCNVGLGHFQDNPKLLLRAVRYLLR